MYMYCYICRFCYWFWLQSVWWLLAFYMFSGWHC